MLTALHALLFCFFGANAPQYAAPSDQRPVAVEPRRHSLTMETAYDSPEDVDTSFGWNNYSAIAPYIDLALSGPGELTPRLRAAGVPQVLYLDTDLCSAKTGYGANRYAGPDCSEWPARAFYTQD